MPGLRNDIDAPIKPFLIRSLITRNPEMLKGCPSMVGRALAPCFLHPVLNWLDERYRTVPSAPASRHTFLKPLRTFLHYLTYHFMTFVLEGNQPEAPCAVK